MDNMDTPTTVNEGTNPDRPLIDNLEPNPEPLIGNPGIGGGMVFWPNWDFTTINQGFADTTVMNGITTGTGAGGVYNPINYRTNTHYLFHKRFGQNVAVSPLLLGMEAPSQDLSYPAMFGLPSLNTIGPPMWLVWYKQPEGKYFGH